MSMPAFRWDDPFRTGMGQTGQYDPGTMYGLVLRAQAGDAAAKNHLAQNGFFDAQGNDLFGAYTPNAQGLPNYQQAVTNWANQRGLRAYGGASPFQWNSTWQSANAPGFQQAWDRQWATGQSSAPQGPPPTPQTQAQPQQPQVNNAYGNYRYGNANPTMNKFGFNFAAPGAGANFGSYLYAAGYNPQQDRYVHMIDQGGAGHGHTQNNWNRIYGWANDFAKANGYNDIQQMSPDAWQKAANYAIGRLRTDMFHDDPTGQRWQQSGFAGADRYLAQGGAGQQPAANGGTGGGGATGQPVASPATGLPTGYQGQNGGTTGGGNGQLTAAQRLALSDDPNQAYRYMMQQIGYNPSAPGLLGSFLKKRFQPLLEARLAASQVGDNANYMDTIDQAINGFGQQLFQKGGNFFGNLRQVGQQAAQQGAPFLNQLQDQNQAMQYLNQLGMLNYAGSNPLVQQSVADEMNRARETYQDTSFQRELTGQNLDPFQQWLAQNPRYKALFGF